MAWQCTAPQFAYHSFNVYTRNRVSYGNHWLILWRPWIQQLSVQSKNTCCYRRIQGGAIRQCPPSGLSMGLGPPAVKDFYHTKMAHILDSVYSVFFQPYSTSEPIYIIIIQKSVRFAWATHVTGRHSQRATSARVPACLTCMAGWQASSQLLGVAYTPQPVDTSSDSSLAPYCTPSDHLGLLHFH